MIKGYHLTAGNRNNFVAQVQRLDPTIDWIADVRPYKAKRTLDQNSRLWKLYTALGDYIGLDSEEVHQLMGYRFLRYQKQVGDKVEEFVKSTTKLSTKEMTDYQDAIERWGGEIGFYFFQDAA